MGSNRPNLQYSDIENLGIVGGYSNLVPMTEQMNAFLLSAMIVMKQQYIWESAIAPIDEADYETILEFIEDVEDKLMNNIAIGSIFWSIAVLTTPEVLPLTGQLISQLDYVELSAVVPVSWLSGVNIQLPDMRDKAIMNDSLISNLGNVIGSNTVTLVTNEIPSHTHAQTPHTHIVNDALSLPALGGAIPATASLTTNVPSITGSSTAVNLSTGGDGSHNNIQASLQAIAYLVVK